MNKEIKRKALQNIGQNLKQNLQTSSSAKTSLSNHKDTLSNHKDLLSSYNSKNQESQPQRKLTEIEFALHQSIIENDLVIYDNQLRQRVMQLQAMLCQCKMQIQGQNDVLERLSKIRKKKMIKKPKKESIKTLL